MDKKILMFFLNKQENEQKNVIASHSQSVLEALLAAGIEIEHSCGGMGTCGTCRIFVENMGDNLAEKVQSKNEIELEMAADRGFSQNERLACQMTPQSKIEIRIKK